MVFKTGKQKRRRVRGAIPFPLRPYCITVCAVMILGCGNALVDTFNETPVQVVEKKHSANWFGPMYNPDNELDATTRATLRVDSGHVGTTQCTLYIFSKYCDGIFRIRLGEAPSNYTLTGRLVKPSFGCDSNSPFLSEYVYTSLNPGTKYYFDIMAFWGIVQPWQLDSCFTTWPDSASSIVAAKEL